MIRAVISEHVNAKAEDVRALYADPENWRTLFPATIRGAHVVRHDADTTVIDVDHIEGHVTNILRLVSARRIELREFKRRFDARFVNDFDGEGDGMRYTLIGEVSLKWPYRLLELFAKPIVLGRMRRYVVEPLKRAAEERSAARRTFHACHK